MRTISRVAQLVTVSLLCGAIAAADGPGKADPDASPVQAAQHHARVANVSLYSYHMNNVGKSDGSFAPVLATKSGGAFLVGTKSGLPEDAPYQVGKSQPVAIHFDASGKVRWEKNLRRKDFLDFEGGSAVQTPDGGFIVFVLSYVHPSRGATSRLVKLDSKGKVLWDWVGRGNGTIPTPFATALNLTEKGSVLMTGHLYLKKGSETANGWTGEVDAAGKLLRDEVGEENPYQKK